MNFRGRRGGMQSQGLKSIRAEERGERGDGTHLSVWLTPFHRSRSLCASRQLHAQMIELQRRTESTGMNRIEQNKMHCIGLRRR